MTLPEQTAGLLRRVQEQTDLERQTPSSHTLFVLYNSLLDNYARLGNEMCSRFSAKEAAYIRRKIENAKAYRKGREDEAIKTVKDADMNALLEVEHQLNEELQAAEMYEQYRTLRDSVAHAIDYIRSLNSYLSKAESLPDPRQ